ncbi:histidine kinase [Nocardioides gansuensis]|uniref:histidine kinase n=1 Tax=Nocardioides gansuensis TaxID=2138300 RepID=A0A2T8F5T1_9ACTN|nr:histidine kinase [Nocardioides gansuensis]PVG81066.1 histidine kinase [Nocardioides gansuensis]
MDTTAPIDRPTPERTRPELTPSAHAWRFAGCAAISLVVWSQAAEAEWNEVRWLFWVEVLLGLAAFVVVLFRRRWPVTVALVVALMSAVSGLAAGPATLAGVSVATYRRAVPILVVGLVNLAAAQTYSYTAPFEIRNHWSVVFLINVVVNGAMMGWGMFIGSRRELIWSLQQRALRAEAEQALRVDQARTNERARIAREMHDVLAHRITQVSMHAGALAFRDDLASDQLRDGLGQIQGQANEALHELRGVLGVLRDDATGVRADAPQPTYDDIETLVARACASGTRIDLLDEVDRSEGPVPDVVGRTAYRLVQEGITNARKHAPGALLKVHLAGSPADGLHLRLRNPLGFGTSAAPGAGLGLVGLAERVEVRGGRLSHRVDGGMFELTAWVPWSA